MYRSIKETVIISSLGTRLRRCIHKRLPFWSRQLGAMTVRINSTVLNNARENLSKKSPCRIYSAGALCDEHRASHTVIMKPRQGAEVRHRVLFRCILHVKVASNLESDFPSLATDATMPLSLKTARKRKAPVGENNRTEKAPNPPPAIERSATASSGCSRMVDTARTRAAASAPGPTRAGPATTAAPLRARRSPAARRGPT